jgi:hypothetical protein
MWANYMGKANGMGDVHNIFKGVRALAEKNEKPPSNLTKDSAGNTLGCAKEVAEVWFKFLSKKFSATQAEADRPAMEALPCTKANGDNLSVQQICKALAKMGNGKACRLDGTPAELYKHSKLCKGLLICLLQKIWSDEEVPNEFARATFVMLFKNKGSTDDPAKYRCIGLLNHSYKVLATCLLTILEKETEKYLSDWQAGFRKHRGCRDNVMILRTLYDEMLEQGKDLYVTFIDYSAAFDSISHKFLDRALKEAGASAKSRALFRAIYRAVST